MEKNCKLLDLLSRDDRSCRTREIALAPDLPKPKLHKIRSTLFNLGLVLQVFDKHNREVKSSSSESKKDSLAGRVSQKLGYKTANQH
jgi:hypothetical protein